MFLAEALRGLAPVALLLGFLALPWTTQLDLGSMSESFRWTESPRTLFTLLGLGLIALVVGREDRWLGLGVGYVAVRSLGHAYAQDVALWVALGALAVTEVRRLGDDARVFLRGLLWLTGLAELAVVIAQALRGTELTGTFGQPNHLGGYLAIVGALAPGRLAPFFLAALFVIPHTRLASVALAVALAVRYRHRVMPAAFGVLLAGAAVVAALPRVTTATRLSAWRIGVADWLAHANPLVGFGFGEWFIRVPGIQMRDPGGLEVFAQAHNEYLQLLYEGGLLAVALLAAWLISRWRLALAGPVGASLAALAVLSLGFFPFHLATTASVGLVALGLAGAEEARG